MKTIKHIFLTTLFVVSLTLSGAVSAQYGPEQTDPCEEEGTICGCMDEEAENYNPEANMDDGSCYFKEGCTDEEASNYDETAYADDGSCTYNYYCRDPEANNYSAQQPGRDDNSLCTYNYYCRDSSATNADLTSPGRTDNSLCNYDLYGCMDRGAKNFDASANVDDGSCYYTCEGQDYEEDRCAAVCSGNHWGCIYGTSTANTSPVPPNTVYTWTCKAREGTATVDCDDDQGKAKCNNSTINGCFQGTGSGATKTGDSWNWTCEYNGDTASCSKYDPDIIPKCGNTKDSCNVGTLANNSQSETATEYKWGCTGTNQSIMCSAKKPGECNNNIKDGCLVGTPTASAFNLKTNQWQWICQNKPAQDSPLCTKNANTDCESGVLYGCTDGGTAVDKDKAKTPGKFNWKCKLNTQVSGLCEMDKDPACDTTVVNGCAPGIATGSKISPDGQYNLWYCELNNKKSVQCSRQVDNFRPPVGVNKCSGAVLESATNDMSALCTNGNFSNPAYSQKNESGVISNIITGLCGSNICTNNFGNYIRITAPDGSNNQVIQLGGTATFRVTVRNININLNTLTLSTESLKNITVELPGAPDCDRSIAQTAILHAAIFPTFDPNETFSYSCSVTNVTSSTFANGKAIIRFSAENNSGNTIETTDATNITLTENGVSKCLDSDGNGKYDACSTSGNGPLCSNTSECITLPPITTKCLDSDGNGKYDACSTSGNGPACSSVSECIKLPPIINKCLDTNNDGKYDACSTLGAGPECSSDNSCIALPPENNKCLDSDKDGVYDSCSQNGNGQTCSTDGGCSGIIITSNRCLDVNNDGQYDACSTLGGGPLCSSAQACKDIPPTNSKCSDTNGDGKYDACSISGDGPTCSSNAGCGNIPVSSNQCLDSDNDGKYDACGFLGTGALCASAQPCLGLPSLRDGVTNGTSWNVSGKVFYDDNKNGSPDEGEGVSRVQIELLNNNTGTRWFKISDSNGDFDISEIPEGAYNLKMTGDGKIVFPQLIPITISGGDYRGTFSGLRQVDFLTNPLLRRLSLTGLYGKIGVGVTDLKEGKFEATTSEYKVGDVSQNSFLSILEKGFSLENTSFSPIPLSTVTPKIATNGAGICGDGIIDRSEICDDGNKNGRTGYCSTDCLFAGEVRPGSEEDLLLSSALDSGTNENYQNGKNGRNKNASRTSGFGSIGSGEEIASKITNYLSENAIVQEIASSFIVKEAAKLVDKVVGLDNAKKVLKTGLVVTTEAAIVTAEVAKYSVLGVSILLGTAAAGLNLMVFKTHWMKYTVEVGDTIDNISDKFTMTERALRKKNPLFAKNGLQPGMKLTVRNRHFMEKDYLDQLKDVLKDVLEKRHLGHLGKEKEKVTKISKISEWFAVALSLSNNLVSPWTAKIVEISGPTYEKIKKYTQPIIKKIGELYMSLYEKIAHKALKK